jgi:hypothetical protein
LLIGLLISKLKMRNGSRADVASPLCHETNTRQSCVLIRVEHAVKVEPVGEFG